jgi:hypothetical protein
MKKLSLIIFLIGSLSCAPAAWCQETGANPSDARIYAFIGEELSHERFPVDTADREKYDESLIERVKHGRMMRRFYESYLVKFKITRPIFNKFESDIIEFVVVHAADSRIPWQDQKYSLVYLAKSKNGRYLVYYHADEVFQDTEKNWFSIFKAHTGPFDIPEHRKLEPDYFKLKPENKFKIPVEVYSHASAKENANYQKLKYPRLYYTLKINEYAIPKYGISVNDLFMDRNSKMHKYANFQ